MKKFRFNVISKDERGVMTATKVNVQEYHVDAAARLAEVIVLATLGVGIAIVRTRLI